MPASRAAISAAPPISGAAFGPQSSVLDHTPTALPAALTPAVDSGPPLPTGAVVGMMCL